MTLLHDRLADLAEGAPTGGPAPDLWDTGVRRHRRRRAAAIVGAALVVVLVALAGARLDVDPRPAPADVPFDELHIPRTTYPPSPWADGTDDSGAPGPLALVGTAERRVPVGIWGSRLGIMPFGVSAADGRAVFLDLPGTRVEELCCTGLTLSPDGTKVGYVRYRGVNDRIVGFGVYDTTTGRTTYLSDPRTAVIGGADMTDLQFSTDSRFLETTYARNGSTKSRTVSLNIWDVQTGDLTVAEPPGHYWRPNLGSGPSGIVWSRGRDTFTFAPATGTTTRVRTPEKVVAASFGPDGHAFAEIVFGRKAKDPWRLLVGPSPDDLRQAQMSIDADAILGWRDRSHVVVRQLPTGEGVVVDLATGRAASLRLDVTGRQMSLPVYAADLWANPLVAGERPPQVHDPRLPGWIAAGLVPVFLLGLRLWWRRRVRA